MKICQMLDTPKDLSQLAGCMIAITACHLGW